MNGFGEDRESVVAAAVTAWLDAHEESVVSAIAGAVAASFEERAERIIDLSAEEVADAFVRKHGDWMSDRLTWSDVRADLVDAIANRAADKIGGG